MKLSVILPCYNEEQNIPYIEDELFPILQKLALEHGLDIETVFIDDGSRDKTSDLLKKLSKRHPEVVLVEHLKNCGLGAALKTGIAACSGDLVVTLDSDLTFHPSQIPSLLDRFDRGDVDCVIGSPTLRGYGKDIPFHRLVLSKGVNLLYNLLLGEKITAVSPIFRLYRASALKKLRLEADGYDINAEIVAKLLIDRCRVAEIPAELTVRKYGVSKLRTFREIRNHLKLMLKIVRWKLNG